MRLITFYVGDKTSFGMVDGDKVFDFSVRFPNSSNLIDFLDPRSQQNAEEAIKGADGAIGRTLTRSELPQFQGKTNV